MFLFLLSLFAFFPLVSSQTEIVKITVNPNPIHIEKTASGQSLNFDFVAENTENENVFLTAVEVSVFDAKDKLVVRKFVDDNGVRPSIETVPQREFTPRKPQIIFNPFHSFAAEVELNKLIYTFNFETKEGRSIIYDGHDFYAHHRRFDYMFEPIHAFGFASNFMRYAYDFAPVNAAGEMFQGDERDNANYFGFGANLYATGSGRIAVVVDDKPDNRSFDESILKTNQMVLFGNYIVINHLNGEFSLYAHLKQGSAKVKVGNAVKQNQIVAQIGASGSAKFPHLHYELRTGADASAEGLPSYFTNFKRVLGAKIQTVKVGQIDSGDVVER